MWKRGQNPKCDKVLLSLVWVWGEDKHSFATELEKSEEAWGRARAAGYGVCGLQLLLPVLNPKCSLVT